MPPGAVADRVVTLPEQIEAPAAVGAVGLLLNVMVTISALLPQGPGGSLEVKVSVAVVSPGPGV